jgi:hypothetical protein
MPKRIKLALRPAGVCLKSAVAGEQIPIETGGFHCCAEGETFFKIIESLTAEYLAAVNTPPSQVDNLLVVIDQENEAEIYVNEITMKALVQAKGAVAAGSPVRKNDLADVREVDLGIPIPRACHQISQMTEAARWMAARKLRAVLS